jgi:hypothetical protein
LINKIEHFYFIKDHILKKLLSNTAELDFAEVSHQLNYIQDYLTLFNSLQIIEAEDFQSINTFIKIIRGYSPIVEDKRKLEGFVYDLEGILTSVNKDVPYKQIIFSDKITLLRIELVDNLDRDLKLLENVIPSEFEHVLDILRQLIQPDVKVEEWEGFIGKLKIAFDNGNVEMWDEALGSMKIGRWDIMNSKEGLHLSADERQKLSELFRPEQTREKYLYLKSHEFNTPAGLNRKGVDEEDDDKQIYLKAIVYEKLKRLFNSRININPSAVEILRIYICTEIKPILNVLLEIFEKGEKIETDEMLSSQISAYEKDLIYISSSDGDNTLELVKLEEIKLSLTKNKNTYCDDFKQLEKKLIILKNLFFSESGIFDQNEKYIFNLLKLIRFKYFSAIQILKIEKLRSQVTQLKENLTDKLNEYIALFKSQFHMIYQSLKPKLDQIRKAQEDHHNIKAEQRKEKIEEIEGETIKASDRRIENDIEFSENRFTKHIQLILDNIQKIINKRLPVNNNAGLELGIDDKLMLEYMQEERRYNKPITVKNYLAWESAHADELHNFLKTFKRANMGKGIRDKKGFIEKIEALLSKRFEIADFKFEEYFEHYFKYSDRLLTALKELRALYDIKLEFTVGGGIFLHELSYFEIEDKKGDKELRIVSITLFGGGQSLKYLVYHVKSASDEYQELKRVVMSLEFIITKYFLYFGKDNRTNYGGKLIYYYPEKTEIDVDEKNSLIYYYLDSIYH